MLDNNFSLDMDPVFGVKYSSTGSGFKICILAPPSKLGLTIPQGPTGYTLGRKTVIPALKQTGKAINIRNTWCMIFKWDFFHMKLHIVSKPSKLVSAVMLLLEQHNTPLLSLHLEVGVTVFFV